MAFRPWLSLQCVHGYFDHGLCTAVSLTPTAACQRWLHTPWLVLRSAPGQLKVLVDDQGLQALPARLGLDFVAHARDAAFHNYTEGLPPAQGLAFVCNETAGLEPTDMDMGPSRGLSRQTWLGPADHCAASEVPAELGPIAPGALVAIRLWLDTSAAHEQHYHLAMQARCTTWQYFISGLNCAGDALCITGPGADDAFEYRGDLTLPNGQRASHFRSRMPLALQRNASPNWALRDKLSKRLLLRRLPCPSPHALMRENFDGEEVVTSPMFIHL
jgi:hypothetical protein